MGYWQSSMIALARNRKVGTAMHHLAGGTALARRFVAIGDAAAAVVEARRLQARMGIGATLCALGEYVTDAAAVERTVEVSAEAARRLHAAGLEVRVSADPTAIGLLISEAICHRNAERIAEAVAGAGADPWTRLILDMEDLSTVEPTLRLHAGLLARGLPVGLTLQARLLRCEADLRPLLSRRTAVRLVKGAFPLGSAQDHQGRADIRRAYLGLARSMLSPEAHDAGLLPIFATHDELLVDAVTRMARGGGWRDGEFELEMLYGVRPAWQQQLRAAGRSVRAYLPFGMEWWPYAIRRVGEHPRNSLLLARALLERGYRSTT